MNAQAGQAVLPSRPVRPLYWSLRRELWENRSVYMALAAVAGLELLGVLTGLHSVPSFVQHLEAQGPGRQLMLAMQFSFLAVPLMLTALMVALFYCLDALHGERRDRSILFWKSLPVSDLTTVLSKAVIPLLVLPLLSFAAVVTVMLVKLLLDSAMLWAHGIDAALLWTGVPWTHLAAELAYGLAATSLWYAPIYGWLVLVSGWVRRSTFLWGVLGPLVLSVVEKIAFGTHYLFSLIAYRVGGWVHEAFSFQVMDDASLHAMHVPFDPGRISLQADNFLASSGLWLGLVFALAFFAAAVWLRRYREPI